jgi:hypothetical protein
MGTGSVAVVQFWITVRTWTFKNQTKVQFKVQAKAELNLFSGSGEWKLPELLPKKAKVQFLNPEPDLNWVQGSRNCLNRT